MFLRKTTAVMLSAIILLAWGSVSWMILPWHRMVANEFTNESEVAEAIRANAPEAGIYWLPFAHKDHKAGETAAFVNALPQGYGPGMAKQFFTQFIGNLISALIVVCLLSQTAYLGYWGRVGFVTLVGVAIGFAGHFAYWNWFGFPTPHLIVTVTDSVVAWLLAGLAMAKLVARDTNKLISSSGKYG